jgi:hypothetical protein
MPPRRRTRQAQEEEQWEELRLIIEEDEIPRLKIASEFLTTMYFSMVKDLNKQLECPICLERLHECCATLLGCGHHLHARCLLRMQQQKCPVCRAN